MHPYSGRIGMQSRLSARDHYIPRESITRIYFGERDQAVVLRLSQPVYCAKLFR